MLGQRLKNNLNRLNNDFNISTPNGHSVLELAEIIWNKINPDKELKIKKYLQHLHPRKCRKIDYVN